MHKMTISGLSIQRSKDINKRSIGVLYLFLVPAIAFTLLFQYLPMFGNYIAFLDYDFTNGWMGLLSPFTGLKNFSFVSELWFWQLAGRTVLYSFSLLIFSFPAPLILALLLNEIKKQLFKQVLQTISYIPHFVSWVTVSGLFYLFLSTDISGLVNNIQQALTGGERISYMQNPNLFVVFLVLSNLWKEIGWGTILYLAAITMIDPQLYEAAEIDGASRWSRIWYITLPSLLPTVCILLIFSLGGLFSSNFDQVFNMQNSVIRNDTNTINTFVYFRGVQNQQYSFAAAVGLFQGFVSFLLIMSTNYVTKKLNNIGII
jgi:putative aldouronate transport system permease protein